MARLIPALTVRWLTRGRFPKLKRLALRVWSRVREDLRRLYEGTYINPLDWQHWYDRAQKEPNIGRREAVYCEGLAYLPDDPWMAGCVGEFLANEKGDKDEADRIFRRALDLKPDSDRLKVALAALREECGDFAEAERLYREAYESAPDRFFALAGFAGFLMNREECDEAGRLFRQALKLEPKNAKLICNFATFKVRCEKNYPEALGLYKTALELAPDDGSIQGAAAGCFHFHGDDHDETERLYRNSTVSTTAHISFFALFMEDVRQDYDEAERLRKKALELEPASIEAMCGYAGFLMDCRHNYKEAERLYRKAQALVPGDPIVVVGLTEFLIRQDRVPAAEQLSEEFWTAQKYQVSRQAAFAAFFRGLLLRMGRGDDTQSLAHLKTALASDLDFSEGDFDALMRASGPALSALDQKLYAALGAAILDPEKVQVLDKFQRWSAVEAAQLG